MISVHGCFERKCIIFNLSSFLYKIIFIGMLQTPFMFTRPYSERAKYNNYITFTTRMIGVRIL